MSEHLLEKGYEPAAVEKRWYAYWEEQKLFAAKDNGAAPGYAIVIPPPNVTGVLHMGHALNNTLQDVLCRYRRSRGDNVLWMPGTDHAGIATQNVVERQLAAEGQDRHSIGRDQFIEKVWQWREQYGSAIINQLKRMGASCDWDRERFTMDEGLSKAVRKVFVQLYEEGMIYQGNYIINWCPRCNTALSDLEVEHEELDGHLYHIRYPYVQGEGGIVVVTTRPETMLGDTAVAVHPEDERYTGLAAQEVTLPLMQRPIPIIRDDYVDTSFGSGGLKVTPAHDPNDFEIARRHDLPSFKVIGDNGCMTAEAGPYEGLDRYACRKKVLEDLKAQGLLVQVENHPHSVGHCYRCKTVVEPNLSKQWFVKTQPLAEKAIEAVEQGRTKIVPAMWTKTYFEWMHNIRDWCISRQIWWGHQIPAWTCRGCGELHVALEAPKSCRACGQTDLEQESDVLDTWFSSALWPFSTMGWPEQTDLLKTFYPTACLVTGFDILFFWVARMMMMGIHFMGDVPFRHVYVHALVRDEHGKKMSKSKGNVIDPLTVIEEYGTDAFRFTLAAFAAQGRDVKMSTKRVEGYRHFINKIWNAARFSLMHLPKEGAPVADAQKVADAGSLPDRWIVSRLTGTARAVTEALDNYKFNEAASSLYKFVWHELCDWYLEAIKPTLYGEPGEKRDATVYTLWRVLRDTLVLLHPFLPFVTEEVWHKLAGTDGSIMKARFPLDGSEAPQLCVDPQSEAQMALAMGVITAVRNIRGEMNIAPARKLQVRIQAEADSSRKTLQQHAALIEDLARLEALSVEAPGEKPQSAAVAIVEDVSVFVSLAGVVDFAEEAKRLQKAIAKLDKEMTGFSRKLENEGFLSKAPPAVVAEVRQKHADASEKRERLQASLEKIRSLEAD